MSKCGNQNREGCGAEIAWGTTAAGKLMPLNPEPSAEGKWVLLPSGLARPATDEDRKLLRPLLVPHWATCPLAPKFRGRK